MYTNVISAHIEAYKSDWTTTPTTEVTLLGCTEGGG